MVFKNPNDINELVQQPIFFEPNNFTSLARTPWAGEEIFHSYKMGLVAEGTSAKIGESWEVSCDPSHPSQISNLGLSLQDLIDKKPVEMLSQKLVDKGLNTCPILLKLLNAAEPLSVQIHPEDGDQSLAVTECGKPESWLVLRADPGAGLYFGL